MELSFECPICLEEYNSECKPLIMPCGHNACIECLTGLARSGSIACPTCRTTHNNVNVNTLTVNYALIPSSPGKSKGSSTKQYILDHMETIQQQLSTLQKADSTLRNDYDAAQGYNRRCRDDSNDKIDLLITTLQNLKKKFNTLIEESERVNEQNLTQRINAIQIKLEERNALMTDLQGAYSDGSELSAQSKINLRNLHDVPNLETQFTYYKYSEHPDPTFSQLLNNTGGSIAAEKIISLEETKPPQPVVQPVPENKPVVQPVPENKVAPKGRVVAPKKFAQAKEEEKAANPIQPRQKFAEKPGLTGWLVQNRFSVFEPVEPWMSAQLEDGRRQGKVEFEIIDPKGNPIYKVNLFEQKSYRWHPKTKNYSCPRKLEYRP
ncbi:unnamed protein product [Blepharisma stoltei]|uniref:RING-type domain-containing protein n=1 Tax=Blepharisma stoltei TaxID=1481888 RepID=A0AAU9JQR6_9CILI|nr:unnamed protein product [Blepharisma stoltei]